jgi:hypothetical protein
MYQKSIVSIRHLNLHEVALIQALYLGIALQAFVQNFDLH